MLTHAHKVFVGLRWVWVPLGAFKKIECLFSIAPDANSWWLAHLSKGEEVRVEMQLIEMMLASVQ